MKNLFFISLLALTGLTAIMYVIQESWQISIPRLWLSLPLIILATAIVSYVCFRIFQYFDHIEDHQLKKPTRKKVVSSTLLSSAKTNKTIVEAQDQHKNNDTIKMSETRKRARSFDDAMI